MYLRGPGGQPLDPTLRTGYRVYREAVRRGVLLRPIGYTMYLCPPLNVEPEDVRVMLDALEGSVEAVFAAA